MKLSLLTEADEEFRKSQRDEDTVRYYTQLVRMGRLTTQDLKDLAALGDRDALLWCENNGVPAVKIYNNVAGDDERLWDYLAERCPDLLRQEFLNRVTPIMAILLNDEFANQPGYADAVMMRLRHLGTQGVLNDFLNLANEGNWLNNPQEDFGGTENLQDLYYLCTALRYVFSNSSSSPERYSDLVAIGTYDAVWNVDVRRLNRQMVFNVADEFVESIRNKIS